MTDNLALQPMRLRRLVAPLGVALVAVLLLVGATIAASSSPAAFVAFAGALVVLAAVAAVRWPRTAIVLVVLSPIVDRYIVADLLPLAIASASHYLSEALLLSVSVILAWRAWADGRLIAAFRHPVTVALLAFTGLAALSAVVNGVPAHIAVIGLVFTLDAVALFFLPRLVGFTLRQTLAVIGVIGGIVLTAAVLAIGQAVLMPRLFGMVPVRGRFGEEVRLASLFGDPNVFGAFLVSAVPFALIGAVRLPDRRLRWLAAAIAFVLLLALWLSFSRGAWIALVLGVGTMLAIVDRRALLIGAAAGVLSFGTAIYMPRNLLVPDQPRPNIVDSTVDRVGAIGVGGDLRTLFVIQSIPIVQDYPLLGVGPGRFGGAVANTYPTPIYDEYGFRPLFWNPAQRTVDNFWLHLLVETGVLGTTAFLAAALIPAIRILRAARASVGWRRIALGGIAAGTAGLAISSGSTMLLEANSIGFLFWLLLGLGALVVAVAGVDDPDRATPTPASQSTPAS
jgi:O-antigen ligase